jgi:hypothetical protein
MERENQSVITAAVQHCTELVAVEGTEPFVFTAKHVSHQLGNLDYILINRDAVVVYACYFATLDGDEYLSLVEVCLTSFHHRPCPQGSLMFFIQIIYGERSVTQSLTLFSEPELSLVT